eukprot:SAG11_NODE_102_length_16709_cov_31.066093_15_plen_173_part_00
MRWRGCLLARSLRLGQRFHEAIKGADAAELVRIPNYCRQGAAHERPKSVPSSAAPPPHTLIALVAAHRAAVSAYPPRSRRGCVCCHLCSTDQMQHRSNAAPIKCSTDQMQHRSRSPPCVPHLGALERSRSGGAKTTIRARSADGAVPARADAASSNAHRSGCRAQTCSPAVG